MDTQQILICRNIVFMLVNILMVIDIMYFLHNIIKYLNDKNDLREYEIDMNSNITQENVMKELDEFIMSRWEEYQITKLGWKKIDYISNDLQEQILSDLGEIINKSISPLMISKISMFYSNKKDETSGISPIDELIANKINMVILNYSLITNKK